jgi:hypothetical protein
MEGIDRDDDRLSAGHLALNKRKRSSATAVMAERELL